MDRTLYRSSTPGVISGDDYMDSTADAITALFNSMALKPTAITNSGNDYTITIDPVLSGGVVGGMGFFVKPNVNNTGAVRMRIGADAYYNVVKSNGVALAAGEFASDTGYFIVFLDGEYRILSVAGEAADAGAHVFFQQFNVSGTWTKPTGLSADAILLVQVWAGGGGGGNNNGGGVGGGGGGGAYNFAYLRAGDLTSSVAVTVGAGGAVVNAGGNSSFGSYCSAFGGGRGGTSVANGSNGGGGGGGGITSAGNAGGDGPGGSVNGSGGNGGGPSGNSLIANPGLGTSPGTGNYGGGGGNGLEGGDSIWGGGGGGGGAVGGVTANGGSSAWGGGGGGGTGGTSLYGGNGGNNGVAGTVPGGGGGRAAVGGAGRVIVRVVG